MEVVYSDEPASDEYLSIFLAGPTPRSSEVKSWRPEAIQILEELGFTGTVMVPERKDWAAQFDYNDQIEWEQTCMNSCGDIAFWVPRDLETMPAFTTNVEFGYWMGREPYKVRYGRPEGAPNTRYLDAMYRNHPHQQQDFLSINNREPEVTLRDLLTNLYNDINIQNIS